MVARHGGKHTYLVGDLVVASLFKTAPRGHRQLDINQSEHALARKVPITKTTAMEHFRSIGFDELIRSEENRVGDITKFLVVRSP